MCYSGKFKEKASILHKIASNKGQDEANGVGKFKLLCNIYEMAFQIHFSCITVK